MYQRSHAQIWFGGIRFPLPLENSNLLNSVAKFKNLGSPPLEKKSGYAYGNECIYNTVYSIKKKHGVHLF